MATQLFGRNQVDATLVKAGALPNGAAASYSAVLDLGADLVKPEDMEFEVSLPAIPVANLGNAETITIAICHGSTTTPTTVLLDAVLVLTGATATDPSVACSARFKVKAGVSRYIRARATKTGAGTDASGYSMTLKPLF